MIAVRQTAQFADWIGALADRKARAAIAKRVIRMQSGLPGDVKAVGEGVMEARVHVGPGYRLYYLQRGSELILLLCGGDKSSQGRDIAAAKRLAATLDDGDWR
jgi:putative addiction module killer protein